MPRFTPYLYLALAILCTTAPADAASLPDTGQTTCFTDSAADSAPASDPASVARDAGTFPRQDCRYGRDPAVLAGDLIRKGAGAQGFDYSKIANNGTAVPGGAALGTAPTDWACTRDNVTGLTWEVKTADIADLRYFNHTYSWFNADSATNGGNAGSTGSNTCNGTLGGLCNTAAYITAVNAGALCGHSDWRLPSPREVLTLFYADGSVAAVDVSYFPNAVTSQTWTSVSNPADSTQAWEVGSASSFGLKTGSMYVRLVRGDPF